MFVAPDLVFKTVSPLIVPDVHEFSPTDAIAAHSPHASGVIEPESSSNWSEFSAFLSYLREASLYAKTALAMIAVGKADAENDAYGTQDALVRTSPQEQ